MPDYSKLRDMVSHRVELEYDSGARIVGYIAGCKPPEGPVQLLSLNRVECYAASGEIMERHDSLSVVPNALTGIRKAEGVGRRDG